MHEQIHKLTIAAKRRRSSTGNINPVYVRYYFSWLVLYTVGSYVLYVRDNVPVLEALVFTIIDVAPSILIAPLAIAANAMTSNQLLKGIKIRGIYGTQTPEYFIYGLALFCISTLILGFGIKIFPAPDRSYLIMSVTIITMLSVLLRSLFISFIKDRRIKQERLAILELLRQSKQ